MRRIVLSLLLVTASAGADDVYRWVDSGGQTHYTDDLSTVPADQRAKAKKTAGGQLDVVRGGDVSQDDQAPPDPSVHQEDTRSTEQREEDVRKAEQAASDSGWRARFKAAHDRIRDLEKRIHDDEDTLQNPGAHGMPLSRYINGVYLPNPDFQQVHDRIDQERAELVKAHRDLDDLDRKASAEAVPFELRR